MEIYTKEDFKQIFIDLGIEKGSKILLEADLSCIVAWWVTIKC